MHRYVLLVDFYRGSKIHFLLLRLLLYVTVHNTFVEDLATPFNFSISIHKSVK